MYNIEVNVKSYNNIASGINPTCVEKKQQQLDKNVSEHVKSNRLQHCIFLILFFKTFLAFLKIRSDFFVSLGPALKLELETRGSHKRPASIMHRSTVHRANQPDPISVFQSSKSAAEMQFNNQINVS